jgi:hypothetical protein
MASLPYRLGQNEMLKGFTISETSWRQNEVMTGNLKK